MLALKSDSRLSSRHEVLDPSEEASLNSFGCQEVEDCCLVGELKRLLQVQEYNSRLCAADSRQECKRRGRGEGAL